MAPNLILFSYQKLNLTKALPTDPNPLNPIQPENQKKSENKANNPFLIQEAQFETSGLRVFSLQILIKEVKEGGETIYEEEVEEEEEEEEEEQKQQQH